MTVADTAHELDQWLTLQVSLSAQWMQRSISAVDRVKHRPGFGQSIRPERGSIIASPVFAAYDPDPDYAFHWFRDSAVVIDAMRLLFEQGVVDQQQAESLIVDAVDFAEKLMKLDGRALALDSNWRAQVQPDFVQYLRSNDELAAVHGSSVLGETRVNPDGSLDRTRWARPQYDGAPLRALAMLRWHQSPMTTLPTGLASRLSALIDHDLAFTCEHADLPSFDIWEEERGLHYYTLRVAAAALGQGAAWLQSRDPTLAQRYQQRAAQLRGQLDAFWFEEQQFYQSRFGDADRPSPKALDIAVILSAVHCGETSGTHTVDDPRMQSTLARLDALFDARYSINRRRADGEGPALGRYDGDVYYSGGAYFFSTLGAAEFCYKAARHAADGRPWIERGDGYLRTVRRYTAPDGALSEQFDQHDGAQTSARHLAWSYAGLISSADARRRALLTIG